MTAGATLAVTNVAVGLRKLRVHGLDQAQNTLFDEVESGGSAVRELELRLTGRTGNASAA